MTIFFTPLPHSFHMLIHIDLHFQILSSLAKVSNFSSADWIAENQFKFWFLCISLNWQFYCCFTFSYSIVEELLNWSSCCYYLFKGMHKFYLCHFSYSRISKNRTCPFAVGGHMLMFISPPKLFCGLGRS